MSGPQQFSDNRTRADAPLDTKAGPFLARVQRVPDPEYMGRIEVQILHPSTSGELSLGQITQCDYMSSFFGITGARYVGGNPTYDETQKSYGMWVPTPDIGSQVIVIFIEGMPNKAYWIGCVPDRQKNFMVPGYAATSYNHQFEGDDTRVPVAEPNQEINDKLTIPVTSILKPVHTPMFNSLSAQRLINDDVRGITSSSARRETPSRVWGVSTPGPVDKVGLTGPIGTADDNVPNAAVSRLGGSSFVMDDGDEKFIRKTTAGEGPPEFVDVLGTKSLAGGLPEIPHNELIRLRTRTGHQILLHNTEDLIYIGNAKGTTWIELTSNGKIDIFAEDSISIHTKNDLNIKADRDINLEAGRNFNVVATGKVHLESKLDFEIISNANTKITTAAISHINSGGNHIETAAEIHMNGPVADKVIPLVVFKVPNFTPEEGEAYIDSIMKRVPQQEPWPCHENLDPLSFTPAKTDNTAAETSFVIPKAWNTYTTTKDTFKQGR